MEGAFGAGQGAIDRATFDVDVLVTQADVFADGRFGGVAAHAHRAIVDVALADPEIFLDHRNGFVTRPVVESVLAGGRGRLNNAVQVVIELALLGAYDRT